MPRRKADAITDAFEKYIALTLEEKTIFAAQIAGFNRGLLGGAVAGRNEAPDFAQQRRGRPQGAKNKPKAANGVEQQEAQA